MIRRSIIAGGALRLAIEALSIIGEVVDINCLAIVVAKVQM